MQSRPQLQPIASEGRGDAHSQCGAMAIREGLYRVLEARAESEAAASLLSLSNLQAKGPRIYILRQPSTAPTNQQGPFFQSPQTLGKWILEELHRSQELQLAAERQQQSLRNAAGLSSKLLETRGYMGCEKGVWTMAHVKGFCGCRSSIRG